jgi:predicted DNA-binding transcriptional regulator AlpA
MSNTFKDLPLMLNTDQTCWCLGISRPTLYRYMKGGRVEKPIKYGEQNRWDKDYVSELMKTGIPTKPPVVPPVRPTNLGGLPTTP